MLSMNLFYYTACLLEGFRWYSPPLYSFKERFIGFLSKPKELPPTQSTRTHRNLRNRKFSTMFESHLQSFYLRKPVSKTIWAFGEKKWTPLEFELLASFIIYFLGKFSSLVFSTRENSGLNFSAYNCNLEKESWAHFFLLLKYCLESFWFGMKERYGNKVRKKFKISMHSFGYNIQCTLF